ncbi:hypothetical protein KQI46_19765 [Lysinibacillus capsici]|uniref:hypothetical protein n=1 Tax=Lysinibacillus capsici TaxID=2115968 RepID=UPI00029C8BEF|nr:hypothetical protein [Lysinibacillus capsici]EKU43658.1 hypothetical protein C518_1540 [Lysinibacillus fusiformis ZB2]MBU5254132.1 hypothetical protein [Lysinibacillus capsici]
MHSWQPRIFAKAGFAEQVTYNRSCIGKPEKLMATGQCFDFFFIDADKDNYEKWQHPSAIGDGMTVSKVIK